MIKGWENMGPEGKAPETIGLLINQGIVSLFHYPFSIVPLFLTLIVLIVYYSILTFYCYHCYHCSIVLILSPTIVTPFYCSTCMVLLYSLKGNVWLYWYHCPVHYSCGTMD